MNQNFEITRDLTLHNLFDAKFETVDYLINWSILYKYIYVETPKVACTKIKHVLQSAELNSISDLDQNIIHNRKLSPLLAPSVNIQDFESALNNENYFKFCFVRNPFSRALSAWLDKFVYNHDERNRLLPSLGFPLGAEPSFHDFLCAIKERSDGDRDIHWASQNFLLSPSKVHYSFVGRFENFKRDFSIIGDYLKINKFLSFSDTKHSTNAGALISSHFGKEETKLVQLIYEPDFLSFGYGFDPLIIKNEKQ
jgi:hypothetical protein